MIEERFELKVLDQPRGLKNKRKFFSTPQPGSMAFLTRLGLLGIAILILARPNAVLAQSMPETSSQVNQMPSPSAVTLNDGKQDILHPMTLSEALSIAEKQNPQLLVNKQNIDLSLFDINIAREIPNPQFQILNSFGSVYRVGGNPNQQNINQLIETFGKRHKRVDTAKAQSLLTQAQFNASRWDIRNQTRQAYAQLAAAEANLKALDKQTELLKVLVDIANKRYQAGASPESDVLQAKLALSQLDTQRVQALGDLEQARIQLNTLMGFSPEQETQIGDQGLFALSSQQNDLAPPAEEPIPKGQGLIEKAMTERPDLKATIEQVHVYQNQLKLTKAQRIPNFIATFGYYYNTSPSGYSAINRKKYFDGEFYQLIVDLPIFHNYGNEIKRAKITIDQANLMKMATQKQIIEDIKTALSNLNVARDNIMMYHDNLLPSSEDVLRLSQESYQYGKTGLTNVILAQKANQQIRSGYLQALVDYQKAWGDLEKAVGVPMQSW